MRLSVRSNIDHVMSDVQRRFDQVKAIALPRALNELREQAQTAGLRAIADEYDVGPRTMEKYVSIKLATSADLEAVITVKGNGFPLIEMKPRQTSEGTSVSVKGKRFLIAGTFLATMKSGHTGVFARGAYGSKSSHAIQRTGSFGRFIFGRGERVKRSNKWGSSEIPINELFTWAPPDAFGNDKVTSAMQDRVDEQASKVIARNIRFVANG